VLLQEKAIARARAEQVELQAKEVAPETRPPIESSTPATNATSQREELGRLRTQVLALQARRDELRTRAQKVATMNPRKERTNAAIATVSMKNLRDAGQNTPADFLETWMWAALHGDTNRVMQLMAFEPETDMRKVQEAMEDLRKETEKGPEALLAKAPDGELRLLGEEPADKNDRWVIVETSMGGHDDLQRVLLRSTQTGWRIVVQTNGAPVTARVEDRPKTD
jgi:hypothetical protein